jgi:hypothetical protein
MQINSKRISMSELFDDDEEKSLIAGDYEENEEAEIIIPPGRLRSSTEARKRLENILEEKRLRDELADFTDY